MAKVIISGYYGFDNTGDEAVLAAIVSGLKQVLADPEIVVLSREPKKTSAAYQVRSIGRTNFAALWYELRDADLFISGGGSLLQDVTGSLTIPYYLLLAKLAQIRGVPVMLFSQGIGPVTGRLGRSLVRQVVNSVQLITVRDCASSELLQELGVTRPPIKVTADPVHFLFPCSDEQMRQVAIAERIPYNEKCPWIGVSLRSWANEEQYTATIASALDELIDTFDARVLFLPFHLSQDRETIEKTRIRMQHFDHTHVVEKQYTPQEIMGLVKLCDVQIGMRLHSLIFAARQGVLPVGISYDPKVDAFLARLGMTPVGTTADLDKHQLVNAVTELLNISDDERQNFTQSCQMLAEDAWNAIRYAYDLILKREADV